MIRWISTGGRTGVVLGVAAIELGLAWLLGLASTASITETLSEHPLGFAALHAQGGRLLGDVIALNAQAWAPIGVLLAVAVLAWAVVWMLLGGMFPVLGSTAGVRWHRAAAESLRRAPTLLGLASIAGAGYALAAFAGYVATGWGARTALTRFDVRVVTLLGLVGWILGGALAGLITVWHDTARAHAMARGKTAMQSSGAAALQMAREPLSTVAAGVGYGLVAWSYLGAAWAISGLLDGKTSTAALVTVMAAQHLAVLGRVHARMKWFVWLGQRVSLAKARAE
ncbi:MAG: hypothetical protein KA978_22435 [Deltaproteobacteria bacterium]|jgi:hypothetical protein|nr:hypothetical protein [Deltaproteobacteria bacterium]